uniref:Thioredoxin domain-containing protein n=1 Tax=Monodelphis domestica TaxID=13616 RepID=A0A5F8GEY5_MONDO
MAGRKAKETRGPGAPSLVAVAVAVALAGPPPVAAGLEEPSRVRAMTSNNWTLVLEGEWMLKFYAPWCPACLQTESEWETFAKNGELLDVSVGKVDVTQEPGTLMNFEWHIFKEITLNEQAFKYCQVDQTFLSM